MTTKPTKPTRFSRLQCGEVTGVPTTETLGDVNLSQYLGAIATTDTTATAKCVVPNGSDIIDLIIDVTTAFEASAAASVELSVGTTMLATIGVSAVGRYRISTTNVTAAGWALLLGVSANTVNNTCPVKVKVSSTTTPSGGAAIARLLYVIAS